MFLCVFSEQEILREEISSLQAVKSKLQGRISQLEEELKKTREDIDKKNQATKEEEEVISRLQLFHSLNSLLTLFPLTQFFFVNGHISCIIIIMILFDLSIVMYYDLPIAHAVEVPADLYGLLHNLASDELSTW